MDIKMTLNDFALYPYFSQPFSEKHLLEVDSN